jgi:hypothetical protein
MPKKINKDRVISFRLTEEQYAPFAEIMSKSGTKPSHFFREVVLNKSPVFQESSKDNERFLFIANKAGNNLNQVAFKLNSAYRRGIVSEQLYLKLLNPLASIRELLAAGIRYVD